MSWQPGGSGGISKLTSTGATVTITSPTGPTSDLEVAAGAGGITTLTGDVTAGPGSGSQAATLVGSANVESIITANTTVAGALQKSGGTMSGALAMGSNKITGLANGSASSDAAAFGQIPTALPPNGSAGGDLTGSYPNPTLSGTANVESIISANTTVASALQPGGALGTPSSGTLTNCSGTAASLTAGHVTGLTVASGKTLTANNSLTLAGTDSTTMTFPTTSATIARTDAAQTFTGVQTFSSAPVLSTNTLTTSGAFTITVPNAQSDTMALLGTAQIFTANQVITAGQTTGNGLQINCGSMTTGQGLYLFRSDSTTSTGYGLLINFNNSNFTGDFIACSNNGLSTTQFAVTSTGAVTALGLGTFAGLTCSSGYFTLSSTADPGAAGTTTACTLGKTGGTGAPATSTMNKWVEIKDSGGAVCYVPVWK